MFIEQYIKKGNESYIENIKVLLYKENPNIFEIIDFYDDNIYREPLLFAYFNNKKLDTLDLNTILFGYMNLKNKKIGINVKTDNNSVIFLPKIGWICVDNGSNQKFKISIVSKDKIKVTQNGEDCSYKFKQIEKISGSNVEYLNYPISVLKQCYYDVDGNLIDVEIESISLKQKQNINKSFNLIKEHSKDLYIYITLVTKGMVVFKVDTFLRNSFADKTAQGIAFFNAYQKDYDEIFFLDDIAHQVGHIIFNTILYNASIFIKISPESIIETLKLGNGTVESRNIFTVFHALFTYYTTFVCLSDCLKANVFDGKKRHEALGRLNFYVGKCYQDLMLIDNPKNNYGGANKIFTEQGLEIFNMIKKKYHTILKVWGNQINLFDMSNQPYNFTFENFIKLNPIYEINK